MPVKKTEKQVGLRRDADLVLLCRGNLSPHTAVLLISLVKTMDRTSFETPRTGKDVIHDADKDAING